MKTWVARSIAILLAVSVACSDSGRVDIDGSTQNDSVIDGSTQDDSAVDIALDAGADRAPSPDARAADVSVEAFIDGWNPTNLPTCNGEQYACSDGLDNDGDGLADSGDPECTGPCDNDEASFELFPIPGDDPPLCKRDCYWDGDSARGNDDCDWTLECDPKSPGVFAYPGPCPYDEQYVNQGNCPAGQTQKCLDFCLPLTPNGCDCFGCCEIYTPAGMYPETVFLGSGNGCTAKTPQGCAPCTQVADCLNSCSDCELCLGRNLADLVPGCAAAITCSPNESPCLDNSFCPDDHYCLTGCCRRWNW